MNVPSDKVQITTRNDNNEEVRARVGECHITFLGNFERNLNYLESKKIIHRSPLLLVIQNFN